MLKSTYKAIKLIFLLVIIIGTKLYSQQEISYMLPDLGTPRMSTYIELIAQYDMVYPTDIDGFYMNIPGDNIRVFADPSHPNSDKIIVGPVVVSWSGRLFATQIFVHPDLEPNHWDWSLLETDFQIPIILEIDGNQTDGGMFYVVQPFAMGDRRGINEFILGQGNLGKRSPRGAMLIDSMVVDGSEFFVSKVDCDPNTPGNQGYLPFVLLSVGPIKGNMTTGHTILNANGGFPFTQDGGPGGGGGGGRFYDQAFSSPSGTRNGGNGFVAGGPGGINLVLSGSGSFANENNWDGTGVDNGSINGVPKPLQGSWESAGGGTGHPFGSSGVGCADGNTCDEIGGVGGGSGNNQNTRGGAGSFFTRGEGRNESAGYTHGNNMVVPLAGGSGGAGGNPSGTDVHSGSGGGGGGAFRIFAQSFSHIYPQANGANGGSVNGNSHGGSGSGGSVGMFAKLESNLYDYSARGGERSGANGGHGYLRFDIPNFNTNTQEFQFKDESIFVGLSLDTTSYVKRSFRIEGSLERIAGKASVYFRPHSGQWEKIDDIENSFTGSWFRNFVLPVTSNLDSIFYIMLVGDVDTPNDGMYDDEPSNILSQAAGNILIATAEPRYEPEPIEFELVNCVGNSDSIEIEITNLGLGTLRMDYQNYYLTEGTELFELDWTETVADYLDTIKFEIKYTVVNGYSGTIFDTLRIPNNSIEGFLEIPIKINLIDMEVGKYIFVNDYIEIEKDTLFLGRICRGQTIDTTFFVMNQTELEFEFAEPTLIDDGSFSVEILDKRLLAPGELSAFELRFIKIDVPFSIDTWYNTVYFRVEGCENIIDSLVVYVEFGEGEMTAPLELNFGEVNVNQGKVEEITITNTGNTPLAFTSIQENFQTGQYFTVTGTTPSMPFIVQPGGTFVVRVRFIPTFEGAFSTNLIITSTSTATECAATATILLSGDGVQADVEYTLELDFGFVAWCKTPTDTIAIKNPASATASFDIISQGEIVGPDAASFTRTSGNKILPLKVSPNDPPEGVKYFIRFDPTVGGPGPKNATFVLQTNLEGYEEIRINLTGISQPFDMEAVPVSINFNDVALGFEYSDAVTIKNNTHLQMELVSVNSNNPDIIVTPQTAILNPVNSVNDEQLFTIDYKPTVSGPISGNIEFVFRTVTGDIVECTDMIIVPYSANVLEAEYTITPRELEFELSPCQSGADYFTISNTGEVEFIYFGEESTDTLHNGEYRYIPHNIPANKYGVGEHTEYREIKLFVNGENVTEIVEIKITIIAGSISIDETPLNFGTLFFNTNVAELTITITNDGPWDMTFLSMDATSIFQVTPDPTGQTLIPEEQFELTVSFDPNTLGSFSETFNFTYEMGDCEYESSITLLSNVVESGKLILSIPKDLIADPRDRNFKIPIYADFEVPGDSIASISTINISNLEIAFNGRLYFPTTLTPGNIILNNYDTPTSIRTMGMSINNIQLNTLPRMIAEISGIAMLGNTKTTEINFVSVTANPAQFISEIETDDGMLEIEICEEGGDRLLDFAPNAFSVEISPNPASDKVSLKTNFIEYGQYSIEIIDLRGIQLFKDNFVLGSDVSDFKNYVLELSGFSTGYYNIIVRTPNQSLVLPLSIIK